MKYCDDLSDNVVYILESDEFEDDDELLDDDECDTEYYTLVGQDGNIFNLIRCVQRWMREVGCDSAEVRRFGNEVMSQHSYEDALRLCIEYTEFCNKLRCRR